MPCFSVTQKFPGGGVCVPALYPVSFSKLTVLPLGHPLSIEGQGTAVEKPMQGQTGDHFKECSTSCYLITIFSEHLILSNILQSLPLITEKTHWSDMGVQEHPLLFPSFCLIKNLNHLSAS